MIKKILLISPLVLLGLGLGIESNSAPASTTGAPDEKDCTTSGCHSTFKVNNGSGNVSINFENGISNYIPGKTYTINVDVNQASIIRFGFQLVALKDKDNTNAGQFTPSDATRNQITKGYGNFSDRKYMTYTYKSTASVTTGIGHWSFTWTAPLTNEGIITFYLAGLAADNDGTDSGDNCYTSTLKINPNGSLNSEFSINSFPNPVKDNISVNYNLPEASYIKIDVIDLRGKVSEELLAEKQQAGEYKLSLPLTKNYAPGVYFLQFNRSGKITIKKLFITE